MDVYLHHLPYPSSSDASVSIPLSILSLGEPPKTASAPSTGISTGTRILASVVMGLLAALIALTTYGFKMQERDEKTQTDRVVMTRVYVVSGSFFAGVMVGWIVSGRFATSMRS